jgi:hypothetical protein
LLWIVGSWGIVLFYVTNSAGGLRAQMTAVMANGTNIKGMVCYESVGYVFPASANITGFFRVPGFGPFVVPDDQFAKLAKLKVQFVWGDHRAEDSKDFMAQYVRQSKAVADLIHGLGGMPRC